MSERDGAGLSSLYPFLYEGNGDTSTVVEQVSSSTAHKAEEVLRLRDEVLVREEERLLACARAMTERFEAGGRLVAFGNGGSSSDAQDVAALFLHPPAGRSRPALSLTNDVAVVTALSNDVGFDVVFARQISASARPVDIAMGLSTSGNSENLVRAFAAATQLGLLTVGLAGYDGGKMAELDTIDHLFVIPSASVHRVQEAQTTVFHVLWELTQEAVGEALAAP